MNALKVLSLVSLLAILHAPAAYSVGPDSDAALNPYHVPGESVDNGLGALPADYTGAEFQYRVLGQKQDSGLGELSPDYTGAEFQRVAVSVRGLGESLDSGLGKLSADYTGAEFQPELVRAAMAGN